MKPRTPYSPPETPITTRSFTASGATVKLYPFWYSAATTSQITFPVFASSAITWASSVPKNGESAIHPPAARTNVPRQLMLIHPDGPPRARIQGKRPVVLRRGIENPIHHQRCGLKLSRRPSLVHPFRHQRVRVRHLDLIE